MAAAVALEQSLDPVAIGVPYGSDASKLSRQGIDSIVFGPGSIDQAHAADEFVPVPELMAAVGRYADIAKRLLAS
mgnify:CR=1 FL=1